MTTENEKIKDEELNEAELSDVKNSIASLCKKYLTGSFFDKLVDTSGIKIAKDILLGDLKNMIGKGTSGPAAKKFAIAIQMAKNPVAVDTIMSNYMLKGDGMGSGIGYSESAEVQGFREYLNEAKKGGCCGGKKKPSEEEIEEAIKVVEAEGYKVSRLEESEEEKNCITEEEIEKAKKIVESRGFKVREKKVNESEEKSTVLKIQADKLGFDVNEVVDLIEMALDERSVPTYLRNKVELDSEDLSDGTVKVKVSYAEDEEDAKTILIKLIDAFLENATGIEAEISEDLLDNYSSLIDLS